MAKCMKPVKVMVNFFSCSSRKGSTQAIYLHNPFSSDQGAVEVETHLKTGLSEQ